MQKSAKENETLSQSQTQPIIDANQIVYQIYTNENSFSKKIELYLKDSNAYGNIYFAKHFEWQGILRESWFSERIFSNMLELEGNFVTKEAHTEYHSASYPFQKVNGILRIANMKNSSFKLIMEFYNESTGVLISKGYQTVVYTDKYGKIIRLPLEIKQKMLQYAIS